VLILKFFMNFADCNGGNGGKGDKRGPREVFGDELRENFTIVIDQ